MGQLHTRTKSQLLQSPLAAHTSWERLPVPPPPQGPQATTGTRLPPQPPSPSSNTRSTSKRENTQHQRTAFRIETSLGCRSDLTTATTLPGIQRCSRLLHPSVRCKGSTWADPEPGPQLAPSKVPSWFGAWFLGGTGLGHLLITLPGWTSK